MIFWSDKWIYKIFRIPQLICALTYHAICLQQMIFFQKKGERITVWTIFVLAFPWLLILDEKKKKFNDPILKKSFPLTDKISEKVINWNEVDSFTNGFWVYKKGILWWTIPQVLRIYSISLSRNSTELRWNLWKQSDRQSLFSFWNF